MKDFAKLLVAWQRREGRHDLPWVGTRDPYRVWLSEIMLQQTQVATVIGYYERFMQRFPDGPQKLAAAHGWTKCCTLWTGLGYYSARTQSASPAAQLIVEEHGG